MTKMQIPILHFKIYMDAEVILNGLRKELAANMYVPVSSLYSRIGQEPSPVEEVWGWRNLRRAKIRRVNGDYILILPPAKKLNPNK